MLTIDPDKILKLLAQMGEPLSKREITDAFKVSGREDRKYLKDLLRSMEKAGQLEKLTGNRYIPAGASYTPKARPAKSAAGKSAPKTGKPGGWLGTAGTIVGVIRRSKNNTLYLKPASRKDRDTYDILPGELNGAKEGDLVIGDVQRTRRNYHHSKARIAEVLGREDDPKMFSLASIHQQGIRTEFSQAVLQEAAKMKVPALEDREDLRNIPLITIDPADARDHDDAVFAEKTDKGFHLIVAIADVAYYVRPGTALDAEAWQRGNSTYFPDRVVPMLPEKISNDICSLRPNEDRACMAVHLWIDNDGNLQSHQFVRGLMRSHAKLSYEQAQAAHDGKPDAMTAPIADTIIKPLFEAYEVLAKARDVRGTLDLDIPERKIVIDENNKMTGVKIRERFDSHKLIEEFMILANVASAISQEKNVEKGMYRVHGKPDPVKLAATNEFFAALGTSLPPVATPASLKKLLKDSANSPFSELISETLLRTMPQARYHTKNDGHFGLVLQGYSHFTSPIRRYADLIAHRNLITIFNLGAGGMEEEHYHDLEDTAEHISQTERQSMLAERDTVDRFTAAWLSEHIGEEFSGRIAAVTPAGLFIRLKDSGASCFMPRRNLPRDHYDCTVHELVGKQSGIRYQLGAEITGKLTEATPMTGDAVLAPVDKKGAILQGAKFQPQPAQSSQPDGQRGKRHGNRGKRSKPRFRR